MLTSVVNPNIQYDESNWAVTMVWDFAEHYSDKVIVVEGKTSSQSLFITLNFGAQRGSADGKSFVIYKESRLHPDDNEGRKILFFSNTIQEMKPACKTFIVEKQKVLNFIQQFNQGKKRGTGTTSTSGHEEIKCESVYTNTDMNEQEWMNSFTSSLGITIPNDYQQFSNLEGVTMHKGSIAATYDRPLCMIL